MLKMDEINKIRKSFFSGDKNKHQLALQYNRSWETIDRIVSMDREDLNNRGKRPRRKSSVMTEDVIAAIEGYFDKEERLAIKRKQRYTAQVIYRELKNQGIYRGSLRRMQYTVKKLRHERGQTKEKSYLPLEFDLGSALQIDHGEVDVKIGGTRQKGYLFVAAVPGHALRYAQVFPVKSQESWGEFHERAFSYFGGIFPLVIYDNDSVVVKEIIGSERKQTDFSLELEEHYGFTSRFCNPASGNEKGAVENAVGYCRRNYLMGLPAFENWCSSNDFLNECCKQNIVEGVHYKTGEKHSDTFTSLKSALTPTLPPRKWRKWFDCRVDKCQLITLDNGQYSVPEKFVGAYVRVALTAFEMEVIKDEEVITHHKRLHQKGASLQLEHYLDQLYRKPHAVKHCKAIRNEQFHPKLQEVWDRLLDRYGVSKGNREFITILQQRRVCDESMLIEAIEKTLQCGSIESATVKHMIKELQHCDARHGEQEYPSRWDYDLTLYGELCGRVAQ
jgi:transposase